MFKVLIDTSVWLELAKDHRHGPVISALEEMVADGLLELITPETTLEEFERNKVRVIEETKRSLQSHFRLVREAVERFGHDSTRNQTLEGLKEVDHTIALRAEAVTDAITRIGMLLHSSPPLPVTNALKQRV